MARIILVLFSDMHSGFKLGVCTPEAAEAIGARTNEIQDWLQAIMAKALETATALAGEDEIIVIHNGDVTHGDRHLVEVMTTRIADQLLIAKHNLKPWLALPNVKRMLLSYGTGGHEFEEGSATSIIADVLREGHPDRVIEEGYHFLLDVDGAGVDIAHHGPHPGSRLWLSGNVARFYLRDLMLQHIVRMETPPVLVLRSHVHTAIDEVVTVGEWESRIIITPPLCIPGDYAHKATRSIGSVKCGVVITEIVDGVPLKPVKVFDSIDLRKKV